MPKKKKEKVHLCTSGDSLFGANSWACGPAKKDKGTFAMTKNDWELINCRKCQASKDYRDICAEFGAEHPFTKAAKKAHETMRKNKEAQQLIQARLRNALTNLHELVGEVSSCIDDENVRKELNYAAESVQRAVEAYDRRWKK